MPPVSHITAVRGGLMRALLVVAGVASAWLFFALLGSPTASADPTQPTSAPSFDPAAALAAIPVPLPVPAVPVTQLVAPIAPVLPALTGIVSEVVPVTTVAPPLSDLLAPVLDLPSQLPPKLSLTGTPVFPIGRLTSIVSLPVRRPIASLPIGVLAAGSPVDAVDEWTGEQVRGGSAARRPSSGPAPLIPTPARAGVGPDATPLVPYAPPAPPLPAPAPQPVASGGARDQARDTDLNRDTFRGSLVAIRAPPAADRELEAGIADEPTFAPD